MEVIPRMVEYQDETGVGPVEPREQHALIMGTVGWYVGKLYANGWRRTATILSVIILLVVQGKTPEISETQGHYEIRREPHYFQFSFIISYYAARRYYD